MARGVKGSIQHGTDSCYCSGCRLPECKKAHSQYSAARQRRIRAERKEGLVPMGQFPMDCSDAIDEIALILGSE